MPAQRTGQNCRSCSCRTHGCRLQPLGFALVGKRTFYNHQADDRAASSRAVHALAGPPVSTQTADDTCTVPADANEIEAPFLDTDSDNACYPSAAHETTVPALELPAEGAELEQRGLEDAESPDGVSEPLEGLPEDTVAELDEVLAPQMEQHGHQLLETFRNGTAVNLHSIQAILSRPVEPQSPSQWASIFFHLVLKLSRTVSRSNCELLLRYMSTVLCDKVPGAHEQDRIMTMASVQRRFGLVPEGIVRFAVCTRCQALYVVASKGHQPHTLCTMCTASGHAIPLFKTTASSSSSVPRVSFLYQSVVTWLSWLLNRPGLEDQLQRFRTARTEHNPAAADGYEGLPATARNVRLDLWDGDAWDSDYAESDVLNLYATFGYDAFNPFRAQSTSWHSTGALVITIASLPPDLRYRQENCLLVGCIPGPTEPSVDSLFHFLEPLIAELAQLAAGIPMSTWTSRRNANTLSASSVDAASATAATRMVHLRLLNFVGDTPARAKVGGFPSHLVRGEFCPACRIAYTDRARGFQEASQRRDPEQHRLDSLGAMDLGSQARVEAHIRATGARFSAMYLLPYWRSVTQMPMDTMHMLHLGLTKTLWHKILLIGGLFAPDQMARIQQSIACSYLPTSECRPDRRLGDLAGGSGTAEQWSALARVYLPFSTFLLGAPSRSESVTYRWDPRRDQAGGTSADRREEREVPVRDLITLILHLCSLVELVQRTAVHDEMIQSVHYHATEYGRLLAEHVGERWITSNTHAATHLAGWLNCFGPAINWSTYHLEGVNGQLSRTLTNQHRNGEMEASFMLRFHTAARASAALQRFASDPERARASTRSEADMVEVLAAEGAPHFGILAREQAPNAGSTDRYGYSRRLQKDVLEQHVFILLVNFIQMTKPPGAIRMPSATFRPGPNAAEVRNEVTLYRYVTKVVNGRRHQFSAVRNQERPNHNHSFTAACISPHRRDSTIRVCQILSLFHHTINEGKPSEERRLLMHVRWLVPYQLEHELAAAHWSELRCEVAAADQFLAEESVLPVGNLRNPVAVVPIQHPSPDSAVASLWGVKHLLY